MFRQANGKISTQNLVPAGVATANSAVEMDVTNISKLAIQVTGTYTGALSLQATVDGVNWKTIGGNVITDITTATGAATIASAAQSIYTADVSGFKRVRITGLAAMTGNAAVTLSANTI